MAMTFWKDGGKEILNKKLPKNFKGVISSSDDIKKLVNGQYWDPKGGANGTGGYLSPEEGADLLQKVINSFAL